MDPDYYQNQGRAGLLGPYLKNPAVFKCPADRSQVTLSGCRYSRVRSISMNGAVGGGVFSSDIFLYSEDSGSRYRRVAKEAEMSEGREPYRTFTFIDVRSDTIWATFYCTPVVGVPITHLELPGSYHNDGANLAFGDGHVEHRRWLDPRTRPELLTGQVLSAQHFDPAYVCPNNADIQWLTARAFGWTE